MMWNELSMYVWASPFSAPVYLVGEFIHGSSPNPVCRCPLSSPDCSGHSQGKQTFALVSPSQPPDLCRGTRKHATFEDEAERGGFMATDVKHSSVEFRRQG